MVLVQRDLPVRNGYDIGIGVDIATGSPMALGAIGEVSGPVIGADSTSGSFFFRRLDTTEELEHELGISAEATGGIGLFSASAEFAFAKSCKVQTTSLVVLITSSLRKAFQQIDQPELSPAASGFVETGKKLSETFGDYFVRGAASGGQYFGVLKIETNSSTAKTSIDAALSANYGLQMSVEAQMKLRNTVAAHSSRTEAFVHWHGGIINTLPYGNDPILVLDALYKSMEEWKATVRDNPEVFSVAVAPYTIALSPPPPNIADIENQRDVLMRCARLRSQTLDKLNIVDYILDPRHSEEFDRPPSGGPDLPALQASLGKDMNAIADAASFAINNPKDACEPVQYMRTIAGDSDFELTPLPLDLPKQKPGSPSPLVVTMPDVIGKGLGVVPPHTEVRDMLNSLVPASGTLTRIRLSMDGEQELAGRIIATVPEAGEPLPEQVSVVIYVGHRPGSIPTLGNPGGPSRPWEYHGASLADLPPEIRGTVEAGINLARERV